MSVEHDDVDARELLEDLHDDGDYQRQLALPHVHGLPALS
jgi:hypothetical protein